jgi:VWFA-related protein
MRLPTRFVARLILLSAPLCLLLLNAPAASGQQSQPPPTTPAAQDDEVLRITTELVQTDVTVVDRQGRFVEGLRPEQFELSLDGKPQAVSFFERVAAGSAREAAQVTAVRSGGKPAGVATPHAAAGPESEGRIIFFFLDDLHLGESSLMRARRALSDFVENQMSQNDRAAIVSASGQIGFLQQLTDYKPVLTAAISRLNYKKNPETYAGKVPISDYQATRIVDHNDRDLFVYLLMATVNEYQAKGPLIRVAANIVRNRVRQIASQSKITTNEVLGGLESLMLSSSHLPGRKLVFFISDGFITETRANSMGLLKRVTEMAARTGVVVYTMDARGTFNDPVVDAGSNRFPDGLSSGTQAQNPTMEAGAMQEPLHILAEDTGGRAIINSNSFKDAFRQAIDETADYYLLAWRPETAAERGGRARIKVSVKGRPDLRVRVRRNYYVAPPAATSAPAKDDGGQGSARAAPPQTPEAVLVATLGSLYPHRTIPTALSVGYVNTADQGLALKASMQIDRGALEVVAGEAQKSEVDVLGAAIDDRGVIVKFKQLLTVTSDASAQNQRHLPVVWNQQLQLPPGLYQVRVAVRERETGRTGGAQQWIEVPDLSGGRFQLSSLFLGERRAAAADEKFATAPRPVMVDVDRRFPRTSVLRFQTYVYNAGRGGGGAPSPDVEIQTRVLREGRAIVTLAPSKLPTDTTKDMARLPYWAEIALDQLPPGKYVLQVTAIERATKASATQRTTFVVE